MARVIGMFPRGDQIGNLVAALREAGFKRQDMIISNARPGDNNLDEVDFIKSETEELGEVSSYGEAVGMPISNDGAVIVAVELEKRRKDEVADTMRRMGATQVKVD